MIRTEAVQKAEQKEIDKKEIFIGTKIRKNGIKEERLLPFGKRQEDGTISVIQKHDTTKIQIDCIRAAYKKYAKEKDINYQATEGLWKFMEVPGNRVSTLKQVPVIGRMIRIMQTLAAGVPYINQKDVTDFKGKSLSFSDDDIIDFIRPAIEAGIIRAADEGTINDNLYTKKTAQVVEINPEIREISAGMGKLNVKRMEGLIGF